MDVPQGLLPCAPVDPAVQTVQQDDRASQSISRASAGFRTLHKDRGKVCFSAAI
jgi:hypothetical protein